MNIEYYEDKEMNVYKLETPLEKLMGKEINEMWEELLPKIEERDKYKDRIDKAIEYIKWDMDKNEEYIEYCNFKDNYEKLLNILKGDNNE